MPSRSPPLALTVGDDDTAFPCASLRLLGVGLLGATLLACADAPPPPPSIPARTDRVSLSSTGETGSVPPFNRDAAARGLSAVDVSSCAAHGGPTGPGHVTIVMATDGGVSSVHADKAPYADTIVGACIEEKFRGVRVPAFEGPPVTLGKQFRVE